MTDLNFGPVVTGGQVEQAFVATCRKWIATYIRMTERKLGLQETRPFPRSFVVASEIMSWPENQTPALIFANLGTARVGRETPEDATFDPAAPGFASPIGNDYWAEYDVDVAVLVVAKQDTVRDLAAVYGAAIRACIAHKATEQDAIDRVLWIRETPASPAADPQNRRTIASYTESFVVTARNVMRDNGGPPEPVPYTDPTFPYPDDADVTDVQITPNPVPLTEELS